MFFDAGNVRWKADLAKKASQAFFRRMQAKPNLSKLVYSDQNGLFGVFFLPSAVFTFR